MLGFRVAIPCDATPARDRPVEDPVEPRHVAPLELVALGSSGVPIRAAGGCIPGPAFSGLPVAADVAEAAGATAHASVGPPTGPVRPRSRAVPSRFADAIPGCPWEIRTEEGSSPVLGRGGCRFRDVADVACGPPSA